MTESTSLENLSIKNQKDFEELKKQFDVIFIEKINHGYDKSLNNTMFHWQLSKLFSLEDAELFKFAEENSEKLTMSRSSMNLFIRKLSKTTTVAIVEQDSTFIPVNHPDYDIELESDTEEDTELF